MLVLVWRKEEVSIPMRFTFQCWSSYQESNPVPTLTRRLHRQQCFRSKILVAQGGLEPPTLGHEPSVMPFHHRASFIGRSDRKRSDGSGL